MEDSMSSNSNINNNKGLRKRVRDDSEEPECNSPEAKRIRDDLLHILDDLEVPETQHLDSLINTFAQEIITLPANYVTVALDSGESSQPDLGYLLEASDDELGHPPAFSEKKIFEEEDENGVLLQSGSLFESEEAGFGQIWGFEDEMDFGGDNIRNCNAEFLALDGLFDYSDLGHGQPNYTWRQQELLPSL